MGARAGRNRARGGRRGRRQKKTAAFSMRSGPLRTIGGGVRDTAAFLTTLDFFDDLFAAMERNPKVIPRPNFTLGGPSNPKKKIEFARRVISTV